MSEPTRFEHEPIRQTVAQEVPYDYVPAILPSEWVRIQDLPGYEGELVASPRALNPLPDIPTEQYSAAQAVVHEAYDAMGGILPNAKNLHKRKTQVAQYFTKQFGRGFMRSQWQDSQDLQCLTAPHEFTADRSTRQIFSSYAVRMCASCPFTNLCLNKTLQDSVDLQGPETLTSGGIYPKDIVLINKAVLLGVEPDIVRTLVHGSRWASRQRHGLIASQNEVDLFAAESSAA